MKLTVAGYCIIIQGCQYFNPPWVAEPKTQLCCVYACACLCVSVSVSERVCVYTFIIAFGDADSVVPEVVWKMKNAFDIL